MSETEQNLVSPELQGCSVPIVSGHIPKTGSTGISAEVTG